MNVYDFDNTIYDGDSTVDFYLFSLEKNFLLIRFLPIQVMGIVMYKLKIINKRRMKEHFFYFLNGIKDIDNEVIAFWEFKKWKLKDWYIKQKKDNDVVISASPIFLLKPMCEKNKIKILIATDVDKKNGHFYSENCHGDEKVSRFRMLFEKNEIEEFYSDSKSDMPLAVIADKAFVIRKNNISVWERQ
ncbi:MAG: haloacid dehalogenase-like hydrolase [Lachnospiraceae bacterium]|nr:haloacid dehalogenase-like hydrolase [Lachnospiraceae bacterium]